MVFDVLSMFIVMVVMAVISMAVVVYNCERIVKMRSALSGKHTTAKIVRFDSEVVPGKTVIPHAMEVAFNDGDKEVTVWIKGAGRYLYPSMLGSEVEVGYNKDKDGGYIVCPTYASYRFWETLTRYVYIAFAVLMVVVLGLQAGDINMTWFM